MEAFGWTLKQWGLALAILKSKPKSIYEYATARKDYLDKYRSDPVENLTVHSPDGDTRKCDYESAILLFTLIK